MGLLVHQDVQLQGHKMMTNELGGACQMRMQIDLDLDLRNKMNRQLTAGDVTDLNQETGLRLDRASAGLNVPHGHGIGSQKDTALLLHHRRQNDEIPERRTPPTRMKDLYSEQDLSLIHI